MLTANHGTPGPRVAVVTVSYGSARVLAPFLDSLAAGSSSPLSIVVADNRPEATVASLAKKHGATYLPLPENPGYGAGMNAGVAALPASVEWILISNPDVVVSAEAVDVLLATGQQDAAIGSVGPKILTAEGAVYPSARAVPSLRTGVGHALFVNLWVGNPWTRAYRRDTEEAPSRRDAGWLSGACLLVRRTAFTQLGGFDPGFFMYFEDVDLGFRLGKAGYRNVYEPAAEVIHTGAHATNADSAQMIAAHHESARRFLNKKYSGAWLWPIRVGLTVGLRLRSSLIRRHIHREARK